MPRAWGRAGERRIGPTIGATEMLPLADSRRDRPEGEPYRMPFYIVHVSGRAKRKRAIADGRGFETSGAAEEVAKQRWRDGDYFIVEAEDEREAERRAIRASRGLDPWDRTVW